MSNDGKREARLSRRAMLARLGLAATAAYAAPVLLKLGEAQAGSSSKSRLSRSRPERSRPSRHSRPGRSFSGRERRSQRRSFT